MRTTTKTTHSSRRRVVLAAALAAAASLGTVAGTASTASASTASVVRPAYSSYVWSNYSGGVNLRSCGNTGCGSYAYMPNGTGVTMLCWQDTQWVYPPNTNYASPRWFEVSSPYGVGFVHSALVSNQTGVGHC